MAHAAISDEIHRHVEAVLVPSKRDILLRLLHEAELCIGVEQVRTAAILAGIALEELYPLSDPSILRQHERSIALWRELRNRAAHPASGVQDIEPKAVAAMLAGVRALLDRIDAPGSRVTPSASLENEFTKIRGKYAFVPTSVDDFLKRSSKTANERGLGCFRHDRLPAR